MKLKQIKHVLLKSTSHAVLKLLYLASLLADVLKIENRNYVHYIPFNS